jgi:cation-transporting P-type ATPase G
MAEACCSPPYTAVDPAGGMRHLPWRSWAAAVATGSWVLGITAGWAGAPAVATTAFVVAVVAGGATFAPGAIAALARVQVGIGLLMTIAGVGALVLGELPEAAALAFLFSLSEALEDWAVARARSELRAVLSLVPETTTIRRGGAVVEVPTDEVAPGDIVVLRAGMRLATDAVITEGRSAVDLSAVTGESIPVEHGPGDDVPAGALNGGGHLVLTATTPASDSTLSRIVHAVEEARDRKGPAQRIADRVARPLVPGIMVVAAAIAVGGSALGDPAVWSERALVVLVAAAPCALAISVPVTTFAAIGAATRRGIVVKGGAALDALARVRAVAVDKTGTLTRNHPRVVEIAAVDNDEMEVLSLAAALEAHSDHPLAGAITASAPGAPPVATDVHTEPGIGIRGIIDGARVRLGHARAVPPGPLADTVERMGGDGGSVVVVERDGKPRGAVAVRDDLRPEAPAVVRALTARGLSVHMLTGDHPATAAAIGRSAGIDDVRSALLPDDKAAAVDQLRRRSPVAMIGDGINDAPALAAADVGIAMGAAGSDVALEAADVAIMGDHLSHVPGLVDHAHRARRIIAQNLVLSGLIIAVLIPLATVGALGLGTVVAVHEGAEVLVIANGLRARRLRTSTVESTRADIPDHHTVTVEHAST